MKIEKNFNEIYQLIVQAKHRAVLSVNYELITLYWNVGQYIHTKVKAENWGKGVVNNLADYIKQKDLRIKGFSPQNMWRMRQFYETYKDHETLSALTREITWTNNMIIISKSKTAQEREFYLRLSIQEKYSSRELERQIDSGIYERITVTDSNLSAVLREIHPKSSTYFKDRYILDFLPISKPFSEKDLRLGIVGHLKDFILEFGKDFTFVGQEYRIQVGTKDFYIDLVFYHRALQCLVAVDLKITDFKPEYLGKMEFYLEALDRVIKKDHEKPSVGIILCKSKDVQIVEYALSRTLSPTMIAEYETKLIDKKVLASKLEEFFNMSDSNED